MKKTHKRALGLTGLALVAAMTTYAAALPAPGVSALENVTDSLEVRVVGSVPEVIFTEPSESIAVFEPNQTIKFSHENVESAIVTLTYRNEEGGNMTITNFKSYELDYQTGEAEFSIDLDKYGFGEFEFTINAKGFDGVPDSDAIVITYTPLHASLDDLEDGTADILLEYSDKVVNHFDINVRPKGTSDVVYKTNATPPATRANIPFYSFTEKTTTYEIDVLSYDDDGNLIYTTTLEYRFEVIEVPKTGALFNNLNIAQEDYLITGLLIFFILSVVAFGVIARSRGSKRK